MERHAFTLVELAIVLVIIGLLVGGVLTGADLIKSAQLYSINQGKEDIVAATMTFQDKYGRLPGDWMHATDTFGSAGGTGSDATCQNTPTPAGSTATCNGNGNGYIDTSVVASDETYRFFQQLGAAGLIKGSYTGVAGTTSGYVNARVAGVNIPEARQSGYGYLVSWNAYGAGDALNFSFNWGEHVGYYRAPATTSGAAVAGPQWVMTPADMLRFDSKFDDGLPGTGIITGSKGDGATNFCTTAAGIAPPGDAGATYNLNDTNIDCRLNWLRVF
ncbi:MAG: prepilin-type N-terminal cleavage/methylation domain-containing protein [Alphaproteobacteria bacterium]